MSNQKDFQDALKFCLEWEGTAYEDVPGDPGGPTKAGITHIDYDQYRRSKGLPLQSVKFISDQEVSDIYFSKYWKGIGAPDQERCVAIALFDTAVNQGLGAAMRFKKATCDEMNPITRATKIIDLRDQRYYALVDNNPGLKKFLTGWLNRTKALRKLVQR